MQLEGGRKAGALGAACALLVLAGGCAQTAPELPSDDEALGVAALVDEAEQMRASGDYGAAIRTYEQARERTPWNQALTTALAESATLACLVLLSVSKPLILKQAATGLRLSTAR